MARIVDFSDGFESNSPSVPVDSNLLRYQSNWNASTNTPTLSNGTGTVGYLYRVSVAGSVNFGAGSITFSVGDKVVYNSSNVWEKWDVTDEADAVTSVNGQTGVVSLDTDDISEATNTYFTTERAQDAVGAMVTNSSNVSLTYSDATPSITADLINTSVTPASYGSASQVGSFTVDAKGRLTAASNTSISITSSAVSDFNEAAQDAVGNILTDGTTVDFTYNDGSNTISAEVLAAPLITSQTAETSADNADLILIYDNSATAARKMTRANFLAGASGSATDLVFIKHSVASGTNGGTATTSSYTTRSVNTLENPFSVSWVSLSSNQFTLDAGSYKIRAELPLCQVGSARLRLRNITDSTTTSLGMSTNDATTGTVAGQLCLETAFTIAGSKTFAVQYYCTSAASSISLGYPVITGDNEIYAIYTITKIG